MAPAGAEGGHCPEQPAGSPGQEGWLGIFPISHLRTERTRSRRKLLPQRKKTVVLKCIIGKGKRRWKRGVCCPR